MRGCVDALQVSLRDNFFIAERRKFPKNYNKKEPRFLAALSFLIS